MASYAKVVVLGSPISKSNFKLWNRKGRAILPDNSGKYHDRYANYETEIALMAKKQNPGVVFNESLIAVLKVFYKSEKRHPDTNNITKSIFDGIEKSGLIVNDAQVRRLIIEEYYDKINPRFELELFAESVFRMKYEIYKDEYTEPLLYDFPSNKKVVLKGDSFNNDIPLKDNKDIKEKEKNPQSEKTTNVNKLEKSTSKSKSNIKRISKSKADSDDTLKESTPPSIYKVCSICSKEIKDGKFKTADGGKKIICMNCLKKLF